MNTNTEQIIKSIELEKLQEIEKILNSSVDINKLNQKVGLWWFICGLMILFIPLVLIGMFVFRVSLLWIVIFSIVAIPSFFLSLIFGLIKFYMIRKKISDWFIKQFSGNFFKATFIMDNKKKFSKYFYYKGSQFEYENGIYIIDEKAVYRDNDNIPEVHYKFGIPNPLILNTDKELNIYRNAPDKINARGVAGQELDLSFSAENLKRFKNDKIFEELTRDPSQVGAMNIILMVMVGAVLILMLIMLLKK